MKKKIQNTFYVAISLSLAMISGCAGCTGDIHAQDPTERGLSYIAVAIVTNAVLRAIFNKRG